MSGFRVFGVSGLAGLARLAELAGLSKLAGLAELARLAGLSELAELGELVGHAELWSCGAGGYRRAGAEIELPCRVARDVERGCKGEVIVGGHDASQKSGFQTGRGSGGQGSPSGRMTGSRW